MHSIARISDPEAEAVAFRSDGLDDFPARFDSEWTAFDQIDQAAIQAVAVTMGIRLDDTGILLARQLDYVKARTYTRLLPPLSGDLMVPTVTDTPDGAESITSRWYDEVGMAKIVANYADDLPRVDVRGRERSTPVRTFADAYGYSTQDVRSAALSGVNLQTRRADAAKKAIQRKENSLKFKGDADFGLYGILTHPNVPVVVATTGAWATATGDQIVDDFNKLFNAIVLQSYGNHEATVVGLPRRLLQYMTTKRMSGAMQTPAIVFLRQAYPNVRFVVAQEFYGVGGGGLDVMFAAQFDEEIYRYEKVMDFNQLPPQARNLEMVVPCEARSGGVVIERPLGLAIMNGL